jgi:hypothetical protein
MSFTNRKLEAMIWTNKETSAGKATGPVIFAHYWFPPGLKKTLSGQ